MQALEHCIDRLNPTLVAAIVSQRSERQQTQLADTGATGYDVPAGCSCAPELASCACHVIAIHSGQEDGHASSLQRLDELLTSLANA
jgi:hypothetical protein